MDSDSDAKTHGLGGDTGQLWAAMSHEIRTPLMGVVGMLEILARTSLTDEQRRIIATAEESSVSLMRIVDDVLDFAKLETSTVRLALAPTDLGALLEGSAEMLAPAAATKGLTLTVEADYDLPLVMCDGVRLRQVLLNLGNNAIKFTERGHVAFTARLWEQDASRTTVRFTVADTGIGIPADLHGFLFKPFSQLATTNARGFGGVGLGLSICRSLINAMGGAIEVESSERGTLFHVTASFARALQNAAPATPPAQGIDVIAVDGGETALGIAVRYLIAAGARVTLVHSMNAIAGQLLPRTETPTVVLVGPDAEADDIEAATSALARMSDATPIPLIWLHPRAVGGAALTRRGVRALSAHPMRRADLIAAIAGSGHQSEEGPTLTRSARHTPALGIDEAVASARAEGRVVLVAEDNVINQEVIRQQLAILGYDCDIAGTGSLAVRALLEKSYLLLLCDCHMPGMDGFELTRIIRSGERSGRARLPIVAITANALPGEAARCKAAGMDDYLAKPIEIRTLEAVLSRWIPPSQRAQTSVRSAAAVAAIEDVGQDFTSHGATVDLRKIAAMYGNDTARLLPVLEQWSISIGDSVAALALAVDDADWNRAIEIVHRIKGSAGIAGAHALSAAGSELEDALIDKNTARIRDVSLRVRTLAEAALGEVAAWRQAAVVESVGSGAIT